MLFLVIQIGKDSYALPVEQVVEVVPFNAWQTVFQRSDEDANLAVYRGNPLAVVDLGLLIGGPPTRHRASNQIIVVCDLKGSDPRVALVAERASEVLRCPAEDFAEINGPGGRHPFLGAVLMQGLRFIQQILPEHIPSPAAPFDW